jgi:hypothetical protein
MVSNRSALIPYWENKYFRHPAARDRRRGFRDRNPYCFGFRQNGGNVNNLCINWR